MSELDAIIKQGEQFISRLELKEAFIRLGLDNRQASIAARGTVKGLGLTSPAGGSGDLEAAVRQAWPDFTDDQVKTFLKGL